jgi:hypothetical protein
MNDDGYDEPELPTEARSAIGEELGELVTSTRATALLVVTAVMVVLTTWSLTRFLVGTPRLVGDSSAVGGPEISQLLGAVTQTGIIGALLLGALAVPDVSERRSDVVASLGVKAVAHAVVSLVYGAVAVVLIGVTFTTVTAVLEAEIAALTSSEVLPAAFGALIAYPLWALIGLGLSAITRSATVAAVAGLLWIYLESTVLSLLSSGSSPSPVAGYLPVSATANLASGGGGPNLYVHDDVTPLASAVVLALGAAVLLVGGVIAMTRRVPDDADDDLAQDADTPDLPD